MDYLGYGLVLALLLLGVAHIINPELIIIPREAPQNSDSNQNYGEGAGFYFICALFVAMFIFISKQRQRMVARYEDDKA